MAVMACLTVACAPCLTSGKTVGLLFIGMDDQPGYDAEALQTLEVLATGTAASGTAGLICPILDARREEFAFALFDAGRAVSRVLDDTVGPIGALLERMPDGPVTFTGDGVPRIVEALRERPGWRSAPEISWYPRAVVTGAVGLRRLTRGEADEPYLLRPVYARAAGITQPAQSVLPEAGEETSETAGEE
jgi:tRNA A37 threonylcarbamoyladenosine modification protein TsaB